MQSSGTLAELPLEVILDSVQKDRATGTLRLRGADGEATLYFLFGHLFHAVDASDQQGEPVVHKALGWGNGDFTFDAKAKLPAEETIKVSTAELLANRPPANGGSPAVTEADAATEPGSNGAHAAGEAGAADLLPAEVEASAPAKAVPARGTDKRPRPRATEVMGLYPVPIGKSLHMGLTAGFVDFPKLLRGLAKDAHSGYVRLSGEGFTGVLLFSAGAVVEAIYDADGQVGTGTAAYASFGDRIEAGEGGLDVIELSPEMVTAIYQLLTSTSAYDTLLARFIKADALLEYLAEQNTSGAVLVRNKDSVGIVLFREGQILGAYTAAAREVSDSTAVVVAICEDPATEIEVRAGAVPAALPVMELGQGAPREMPSGSAPAAVGDAAAAEGGHAEAEQQAAANQPGSTQADADRGGGTDTEEALPARAEVPAETDGEAESAPQGKRGWDAAVNEMAARADAVLGTRSKKVKELLFAAGHTQESIDSTIARISELSIMFVDPSKLSSLADEFRQIAARTA